MSVRRQREIIERLPGGYVIDVEGNRSVETAQTVATIILRIWPDVGLHVATAWRANYIAAGSATEEVE